MGIDPVTHSPRLDLLDLSSILNTPPYSQTSHLSSLFGVQTLVDPDILRLATSIMSPQLESSNCLPQDFQPDRYGQQLIQDQLQAPVQEVATRMPLSNEASQFMDNSSEEYHGPFAGYSNEWYSVPEQNLNETLNPAQEMSFASVLSAATSSSSTPGNSNSQCINAVGGIEDERESYCSNLWNYMTIPDLLDINSCNEIQQLIGDKFLGSWNAQS